LARCCCWITSFELNFAPDATILDRALAQESHTRIKDLPEHERPRERLVEKGADALNDSELIAILLRTGTKEDSAVDLGDQLVKKYRTLDMLARASLADLQKIKGIGRDKAVTLKSAFTLAQRMARQMQGESPYMDRPDVIADMLLEEARTNGT